LGYVEGQTLVIEPRYAEGALERLPELATQLIRLPVDVILAMNSQAAVAAKDASATTPVVFVEVGNPSGIGLVDSLAMPGGHITGLAGFSSELAAKRVELLRETAPWISHVSVLRIPSPANTFEWIETRQAAQMLGLAVQLFEFQTEDEFDGALAAITRASPDALLLLSSTGLYSRLPPILAFATHNRLPTMTAERGYVTSGALMVYAPNPLDQWRRSATYVDKILKGAKPAELPVEQPMTFDFVINLKTAQALGLTIPEHVLLQATEVLQ
jgi:putative ABC transport system substrate-binding protein